MTQDKESDREPRNRIRSLKAPIKQISIPHQHQINTYRTHLLYLKPSHVHTYLTMMFQKALILLALTCADAFTFSPSASRVAFSNQLTHQQSPIANAYTRLYAEESEEVEAEAAEVAPKEVKSSGNTADDILNSPAFLSRKLDVLNSDVAAVTEKIEAANALYEENKEEWGPQIEKLRSEVSFFVFNLRK